MDGARRTKGREDDMQWKSEWAGFDDPYGSSSPPRDAGAPASDEAFPTAEAVMREIVATIGGFLAIALAVNLLLTLLGV